MESSLIIAILLFVTKCSSESSIEEDNSSSSTSDPSNTNNGADSITLTPGGKHVDETNTGPEGSPAQLVGRISTVMMRANETGDIQPLLSALGQRALTPAQAKNLRALAVTSRLKLDQTKPFSHIKGFGPKFVKQNQNLFEQPFHKALSMKKANWID